MKDVHGKPKGVGDSLASEVGSGGGCQGGFDAQSLSWFFYNKIPTIEANAIKSRARHHRRKMRRAGEK